MTTLKKTVERTLEQGHRGRPFVVRFAAEGVYMKLRGQHWSSAYLIPWTTSYWSGIALKAAQIKRDKKAKREARKG